MGWNVLSSDLCKLFLNGLPWKENAKNAQVCKNWSNIAHELAKKDFLTIISGKSVNFLRKNSANLVPGVFSFKKIQELVKKHKVSIDNVVYATNPSKMTHDKISEIVDKQFVLLDGDVPRTTQCYFPLQLFGLTFGDNNKITKMQDRVCFSIQGVPYQLEMIESPFKSYEIEKIDLSEISCHPQDFYIHEFDS